MKPDTDDGADWIFETHEDHLQIGYRVDRRLYAECTPFQKVEIVETGGHGKMLLNDGLVMVSERDEFVYHEMIAHVPLFVHPKPERVLVIGGGDGGTVREVLRHESVRYCRLVEIDGAVVESCRKHLPRTASALDDPRADVKIEDGLKYVAETGDRYDVVLVDSTDPIGPGVVLFGEEFYRNVSRVLDTGGVVVSQALSPFYDAEKQRALVALLSRIFERTQLYNYSNLTYPGGIWSFSFATSGKLCPVGDFDPKRLEAAGFRGQYYNGALHRAAFAHPEFQRRNLEEFLTPLERR